MKENLPLSFSVMTLHKKRTWCPQKAPIHTYTYTYTYTYAQQQMRAVEWLVEKGSILSF